MVTAKKISLKEIQAYGKKWQPRIHLMDWKLSYEILTIDPSDPEAVAGRSHSDWLRRTGIIYVDENILAPKWNDQINMIYKAYGPRAAEAVVIHEMLHIHEAPVDDLLYEMGGQSKVGRQMWDYYVPIREQLIDAWTRTLIEAYP